MNAPTQTTPRITPLEPPYEPDGRRPARAADAAGNRAAEASFAPWSRPTRARALPQAGRLAAQLRGGRSGRPRSGPPPHLRPVRLRVRMGRANDGLRARRRASRTRSCMRASAATRTSRLVRAPAAPGAPRGQLRQGQLGERRAVGRHSRGVGRTSSSAAARRGGLLPATCHTSGTRTGSSSRTSGERYPEIPARFPFRPSVGPGIIWEPIQIAGRPLPGHGSRELGIRTMPRGRGSNQPPHNKTSPRPATRRWSSSPGATAGLLSRLDRQSRGR